MKVRHKVANGVSITTPGKLPECWVGKGDASFDPPSHYVIMGAGKTAMDVGVWLMAMGVALSLIHI